MKKVAFATMSTFPDLYEDDQLVIEPCKSLAIDIVPAVWTDPSIKWNRFDLIVMRSTWDYDVMFSAYLSWFERLEKENVRVANPIRLMRGNLNKRYLEQMTLDGFATPPTFWLTKGHDPLPVIERANLNGYADLVCKPGVGAGGRGLVRSRENDLIVKACQEISKNFDVMIQPFLPAIADGEVSLFYFNGEYSHAVIKTPAQGRILCQTIHGGITKAYSPGQDLKEISSRLVTKYAAGSLYARSDWIYSNDRWLLGELELTEPSLYLGYDENAPLMFARAISNLVGTGR